MYIMSESPMLSNMSWNNDMHGDNSTMHTQPMTDSCFIKYCSFFINNSFYMNVSFRVRFAFRDMEYLTKAGIFKVDSLTKR